MTNNEFFFPEDEKGKKKKLKRPNKKLAFTAVFIILLCGVALLSFEWAFDALVHTRAEIPVPDITKKSLSNGLDILSGSNLAIKKAGEEHAEGLPPGYVIRQLPAAGSIVREGRIIRVWLSQGTEVIQMPNLVGMTLRDAQILLKQSGLNTGTVASTFSLQHEKGIVSTQSFPEASPVNKGTVINLVVSNGPPESSVLLIPDFRQKKLTEVTHWASQNGIEVLVKDDPESLFPNGTVVAQSPEMDTEIERGSVLNITVSRRKVEGEEKMHRIYYEMAQGKNDSRVRIVLIDSSGEKEILNEMKKPGSKIDITVPYGGEAKVRIYVNNILVREREMK